MLSLLFCLGGKTKLDSLSSLKTLFLEAVFLSSVSIMTKGRKLAKVFSTVTEDGNLQKLVLGNLNDAVKRDFNKNWYYHDISVILRFSDSYSWKWKHAQWCSTWDPGTLQDIYFHIASNVLYFIPFVLQRKIEKPLKSNVICFCWNPRQNVYVELHNIINFVLIISISTVNRHLLMYMTSWNTAYWNRWWGYDSVFHTPLEMYVWQMQ